MDSRTPTPPRRQSERRSTPRAFDPAEGYRSPPGGASLGRDFDVAQRQQGGGTASTPFSVADSSPSPGETPCGGGGSIPKAAAASTHGTKGGQPSNGRAKERSSEEGGTSRLCWGAAEKVVLYRAIQKRNPFAAVGQRAKNKKWEEVAKDVRKPQDVEFHTDAEGQHTVFVDFSKKTKNMETAGLVTRCQNLFGDNRRRKEKDMKKEEGKTGEGEQDEQAFDQDSTIGSETFELLQAMDTRQSAIESKKREAGPSKEDKARGLAIRDGARDGSPGRGASTGSSRNSKRQGDTSSARHSKATAAKERSRGQDCRFQQGSEDSDSCGSVLVLEEDDEEEEEEEEEGDDDEDARREDRRATQLASGKAGRGTRSAKGGGKRKVTVPSLSATTQTGAGLQGKMERVLDVMMSRVSAGTGSSAGGGDQGRAAGSAGSGDMRELLETSIRQQQLVNQQLFNAMGAMQGAAQQHALGMPAGAGAFPGFGGYAGHGVAAGGALGGFGSVAASAGLGHPGAVGVAPPFRGLEGATAAGATASPAVTGGVQAAGVGDASSAGGFSRLPSFSASHGGRTTAAAASSAVSAGGARPSAGTARRVVPHGGRTTAAAARSAVSAGGARPSAGTARRVVPPQAASAATAQRQQSEPVANGGRVCGCGLPVKAGTVKNGGNAGRRFQTCPRQDRNQVCSFYEFLDPPRPQGPVSDEGGAGASGGQKKRKTGGHAATTASSRAKARGSAR